MYRITAIICSAVISISSILGAAFAPTLPYVPPADVQILGLINNIYGMTAISETNQETKMEAYWNMYRAIMGSAFDTFQAQMQEVLDGAKTSRKILITPTLNQTINAALKNAKQNNIPIGQAVSNATSPQQWVERLEQRGIHMTLQQANDLKNRIGNKYAGASNTPYTLGVMVGWSWAYSSENSYRILFMPYYVGINAKFKTYAGGTTNFYYGSNENPVSPFYIYNINMQTMEVGSFQKSTSGGNDSYVYQDMKFTLGAQQQTTSISAMSNAASASITAETQIPLTSETEVVNGAVDPTESIVVNLPNVTPYPAIDPQQIAEVLRELGVVPVSETSDISETVSQLKDDAISKYGEASEYALDLTRYFPFCLPFDVARILQAFVAEPEAPSFSYTINNPFSEDPEDDIVLEIDLAQFNDVAAILRTLESIAFVVGLAVVTRSLYLRG